MYFLFKGQDYLLPEAEEITMISIQLAARFLFTTGFHTKKIVRGPASDWYMALNFIHIVLIVVLVLYYTVLFFPNHENIISNVKYRIKILAVVMR